MRYGLRYGRYISANGASEPAFNVITLKRVERLAQERLAKDVCVLVLMQHISYINKIVRNML